MSAQSELKPIPATHPVSRPLLRSKAALALATTWLAPALAAQTQVGADFGRLMSPTAGMEDHMGAAVAVHGGHAVVGVPLDDNSGVTNAGSAHVYRRGPTGWLHTQELLPGPNSTNLQRGASVAIHDDVIVLGSYLDSSAANQGGAAVVYVTDDSVSPPVWVEVQQLVDPEASGTDWFGFSVAASADWIAVGCHLDNVGGGDTGSVLLFQRDDAGTPTPLDDSWSFSQRLLANPQQGSAWFGYSIDLDGTQLVVGAPREWAPQANTGAAYVYSLIGNSWTWQARLLHPASANGDLFGDVVAIDGNTVAVGAPGYNLTAPGTDEGALYVFDNAGGSWTLNAVLTAPDAEFYDRFGSSVDVSGVVIAVGAEFEDTPRPDSGTAYLFRNDGSGWEAGQKLSACDAVVGDNLGAAVALDGEDLFLGAPLANAGAPNAGAAYAYRLAYGQFERFGQGDGSGAACPCVNESLDGLDQGCLNSTGFGGRLSAYGSDSAQADDVRFSACGLPALQPALLFSGLFNNGGLPFGDGIKAVGGALVRRGVVTSSPEGMAIWGPGLGGSHPWTPGTRVYFQAWHRDPVGGPCGTGNNLTSGQAVTFQ